MGLDNLITRVNGQVIDQEWFNLFNRALEGAVVGRDASGAPTAGQNLGTSIFPWRALYTTTLILDGSPIDPGLVTASPNRIISGAVRSTSNFPDYLRPPASGLSFTILGATTPLVYDVNGEIAEISADIVKSGLTGGPTTNNTCQVNDTSLTGQDRSRFLGENGTVIPVNNMQSELISKIGQFVAIFNNTTSEIFYCRIASSTSLDHCSRGFFFDSTGAPLPAEVLSNNDTLRILTLGFVFAENNGTTIDVTYANPVISGIEPSGPATGDYWYDLNINTWKRYSGSSFAQINRTFIGFVATGLTSTFTRPEYLGNAYRDTNTLDVLLQNVDIVQSEKDNFLISVDGQNKRFDFGFFEWDAVTDFESGVTRTGDRDYWLYITEDGKPQISDQKPYDVLGFLRGYYHPHNSWRAVASVYNNASDEFELVNDSDERLPELVRVPDQKYFKYGFIAGSNSGNPDEDIDITQGRAICEDSKSFVFLQDDVTALDMPALNGAALAADTSYYLFRYLKSDNSSQWYLSTSLAPTISNIKTANAYRMIVSFLTDSSSDIIPFHGVDEGGGTVRYWRERTNDIFVDYDYFNNDVALGETTVGLPAPANIKYCSIAITYARSSGTPELYFETEFGTKAFMAFTSQGSFQGDYIENAYLNNGDIVIDGQNITGGTNLALYIRIENYIDHHNDY